MVEVASPVLAFLISSLSAFSGCGGGKTVAFLVGLVLASGLMPGVAIGWLSLCFCSLAKIRLARRLMEVWTSCGFLRVLPKVPLVLPPKPTWLFSSSSLLKISSALTPVMRETRDRSVSPPGMVLKTIQGLQMPVF